LEKTPFINGLLGEIATFAPADNVTVSANPFRLLTTWPLAMLSLVIEPAVTLLAVVAVVAVAAVPATPELDE
jgi:hypothetical protein